MATLHIDKIIAEKVNQDDLIRLLETVIDEEMQRPEAEMNCDLIDQCVDALLEMRQDRDHLAVMVPLVLMPWLTSPGPTIAFMPMLRAVNVPVSLMPIPAAVLAAVVANDNRR